MGPVSDRARFWGGAGLKVDEGDRARRGSCSTEMVLTSRVAEERLGRETLANVDADGLPGSGRLSNARKIGG